MNKKLRGPQKGSRYNNTHPYPFGKALATQRRKKGYTQEELGQIVGTSKRVISHLEREVKNPPADTLKKLSKALKVPVEQLISPDKEILRQEQPIDRGLSKRFEIAQKLPLNARNEIKKIIDVMAKAHGLA